MSLRLILGRAGSGKTFLCLQEIHRELKGRPFGPPLIFLVPEQATFQMEQSLLQGEVYGSARARVLSFSRLAHMVFSEVGGTVRPRLSEVGRKMLLRSLVHRRRRELSIYQHVVGEAGFIEHLLRTFSEFRLHGVTPSALQMHTQRVSEEDPRLLAAKLHDLSLLYQDYVTHIADRYADPDSLLGEAADILRRSRLLERAEIWVDGFAGFTPQEFKMLHALFQVTRRVNVALCLDPDAWQDEKAAADETHSLFKLPIKTARELVAMCRHAAVAVEEPVLLRGEHHGRTRYHKPVLAYLEQNWEKASAEPYGQDDSDCVVLRMAEDRISEVEAVAADIQRLVRRQGYRYKEISVIVRSLDVYAPYIAAVFARTGIPYFVDQRRDMLFHPLVQALAAALEALATRWHSEPILRFLKTDIAPLTRDEVDRLENYVLEHGITGRAWVSDRPWEPGVPLWEADAGEETGPERRVLEGLDAARNKAVGALSRLNDLIGPERTFTPKEAAQALWSFLSDLRAEERVRLWIDRARDAGDSELVMLHTQVWNAVVALLDEMAAALPDDPIDLDELIAMLDEGFHSLRLGLIPPKLDQVLVGAIDRSRQPDVRAVFVLGLVDREFPAVAQEDAILTDLEREALKSAGFKLGESSLDRMRHERFYGYIAVTRASERLVLSTPGSDGRGRALLPSAIFQRARRLLPKASIERVGRFGPGSLRRIVTPQQAAGYVVAGLRRDPTDAHVLDAYEWLITHPDYAPALRAVLPSLVYSNELLPLPGEVTRRLYGDPLITSVSRLERFAACPFQHFAHYGLGLKERAVLRLDPSRLGTLIHTVLKAYVDYVQRQRLDWQSLTDDDAYEIVDRLTLTAARELAGEVLLSSGRQRYLIDLSRRTLRTAVRLLNEQMRAGRFRPMATELGFGRPNDRVVGWRLDLPSGGQLQLVGVIDRLDHARVHDTDYLRVVDYKSYARKIRWADILQGLELQLIVYLGVATDHFKARPAAALYQPVRDPVINTQEAVDEEEAWRLRKTELRMSGILSSDHEGAVALAMDGTVLPSSSSTLVPFGLKKDGSFNAYSSVAGQADLTRLIEAVRHVVVDLAERIRLGEHSVRPFRRANNERACNWCAFHPVCRFDVLIEGSAYRNLESYKLDELLRRLRRDDRAADAGAS